MLLAQVEAFVEIAWQGSMRQAGETIHLSQPALSSRIVGLERELGVRLFDRRKRGMTLTPAGRAFLPHAERLLETARSGIATVRDFAGGRAGEIIVAATPAISTYVLPELIRRFRARWPTVRMFVRTLPSEGVADLVLRGDAHLGIVREHRIDHLRHHPIYEEELVLVAHPGHPLVGGDPVDLTRLRQTTLILLDRRWPSTEFIRGLSGEDDGDLLDTIEIDNVELAKRLVGRGVGVAMLPMTAIASEIERSELVRLQLGEVRRVARKVLVVERASALSWSPLDDLRELLDEIPDFVPGAAAVGSALARD